MNHLVVVNSQLSPTTARFWKLHGDEIVQRFREYDVFVPPSRYFKLPSNAEDFDAFIIIGSDCFLNVFVNTVYYNLADRNRQKFIAFIPDLNNSAVARSLELPSRLNRLLDLIEKKQTILLDLIRCHFIDKKGIPDSRLILNDILVGLSPAKVPLIVKTFLELVKTPPLFHSKKRSKGIVLISKGNKIYQGKYVFAFILLGNRFIKGPKIPYRFKSRVNLNGFDYYQLNSLPLLDVKKAFGGISESGDQKSRYLLSGNYQDLIAKGEGEENTIIGDGIHLGRLPATFSFLPKALRIIAPHITIKVNQPVAGKVTAAGIPKPIGSRNSLRNKE